MPFVMLVASNLRSPSSDLQEQLRLFRLFCCQCAAETNCSICKRLCKALEILNSILPLFLSLAVIAHHATDKPQELHHLGFQYVAEHLEKSCAE